MSTKCKADGCNNDVWSNGGRWKSRLDAISCMYCRKHVRRIQKYGSPDDKAFAKAELKIRFSRYVSKADDHECWIWTGSKKSKNGYGSIWDNSSKKSRLAHRVAYELATGVCPPDDMVVMHTCDNPSCVNPNHLTLGTAKENTQDMISKGRKKVVRVYGEENPVSKLTLEQAKYIKAHPEMKLTELANMFGLSPNCIRGVRTGRTWRDA